MSTLRLTSTMTAGFCAAIAIAALAALWLIATPGPSAATMPPPPNKAEIVFENGGRIISIRADGTDRRILTRRRASMAVDRGSFLLGSQVEDSRPSISPDGKALLFLRSVDAGDGLVSKLMLAGRDGTGAREVMRDRDGGLFTEPSWDPGGGRIIYTEWIGGDWERPRFRTVSTNLEGRGRRVLLDRTFKGFAVVGDARMSSGRDRLLYTVFRKGKTRIRILNLETRADRTVGFGSEVAWSPDGSRIAFVRGGAIRTVDAHGKNQRAVVKTVSASGLSWSPDGRRLAFASPRNYPGAGSGVANEIYSVAVKGRPCLTWLTNGSPASESPSWAPGADRSTAPAGCGDGGRSALAELTPPKKLQGPGPHLWVGPGIGDRLLSNVSLGRLFPWSDPGTIEYEYGDCPFYSPSRCRQPLTIQSIPQCDRDADDSVDLGDRIRSISRRRSALLVTTMDRRLKGSMLFTGPRRIGIGYPAFVQNRSGKPITMRDHLAAVRALRPVGSVDPDRSALPREAIPQGTLRFLKRVARAYHQTGSVRAAGKKLKMPSSEVRKNLRLLAYLKSRGPIRTFTCPKR